MWFSKYSTGARAGVGAPPASPRWCRTTLSSDMAPITASSLPSWFRSAVAIRFHWFEAAMLKACGRNANGPTFSKYMMPRSG